MIELVWIVHGGTVSLHLTQAEAGRRDTGVRAAGWSLASGDAHAQDYGQNRSNGRGIQGTAPQQWGHETGVCFSMGLT